MPKNLFSKISMIAGFFMLFPLAADAAKMIDMRYQPDTISPVAFSQSLTALPANQQPKIELKQVKKEVDEHGITHIRYQQFYQGVPVWGGETIEHISAKDQQAHTNGIIFQDLTADLQRNPPGPAQVSAAEEHAIQLSKNKTANATAPSQHESQLVVYIDDSNKAHWAVHVTLYFNNAHETPDNPNYLIDANTFEIYQEWNNVNFLDDIKGGGLGGNPLLGINTYDGLPGNKPALDMQRDSATQTCYLQNKYIMIRDGRTVTFNAPGTADIMFFPCPQADPNHGNIYWNGALDQVNEAWSPANDALYLIDKVDAMYEDWFHIPVLYEPNADPTLVTKRMKIMARVHDSVIPIHFGEWPIPGAGNAAWDPVRKEIVFGDNTGFWGDKLKYPFVVPGVIAHELSHGFTHQHSKLMGLGEPGAVNEAFSDMADAALDYYLTGHNTWQAGAGVKKDGTGIRSLNNPTQDGKTYDNAVSYYKYYGRNIGRLGRMNRGVNPHPGSGIFSKAFYLLSQPKEQGGLGNTKLAFEVMVQANRYYWTGVYLEFNDAACGIWDAARDLNYNQQDLDGITRVMLQVGLNTSVCHLKNSGSPK